MNDTSENTFTAYLGPEFQQRLMWQLLVEPEFAERIIPNLSVEYFEDANLKRLFLIILNYVKEYEKVPNLQNQSILQAINEFKTPNNQIEEESLTSIIERIKLWNERVLNKQLQHDGDVVQKATNNFIKQQEYRKIAENIIVKCKNGDMKNKNSIAEIEEKFHKVAIIGNLEDNGKDVTEELEKALRKEFRKTIPTGITVIDELTGGGLGKGEFGLILTPSGVGKTTMLTKIANTAREQNLNVLQIIFEDTVQQIQRKHVTIWTGIPLSQLDEYNDVALLKSNEHIAKLGQGKLTIKKFSQEDTTMKDIRSWIINEQKRDGFKYDIIVLDYLDCLESHKRTPDRNEAELVIVKSFEAMASDFDIPCWSAIQSNRSGFDAELVEAHQTGGNIKRLQKSHFFMSVAKTPDQKEASLANIRIIKARFAQDGQTFRDCKFNNDTMEIEIRGNIYVGNAKKYGEEEIAKFNEKKKAIDHGKISNAGENAILADLKNSYLESTKTETPIYTVKELEPEHNISATEPEYTVKENDDLIDIEDKPIENAESDKQINPEDVEHDKQLQNDGGINEGTSEGVNYIVPVQPLSPPNGLQILYKLNEKEPFDWSGETITTATNEIEVKHEDIKVADGTLTDIKAGDVLKRPETEPTYLTAGILTRNENNDIVVLGVAKESKITPEVLPNIKNNGKIRSVSEIEKVLIDPDDVPSKHKNVYDMLREIAKSQQDIKKE